MGTVRFLLALAVAAFHLALIPNIGHMAVHAFFVLSGYLMTLVMQSSYTYTRAGFGRFWLNRVLRLYPMYLIMLGLMAVLLMGLGSDAGQRFESSLRLPATPAEWIQNLSFIYWNAFPAWSPSKLLPPSWALTMEMVYYLLISVGLSRTRRLTWIWFGLSLVWSTGVIVTDLGFAYGYYHIASASLPFSIGALAWHYRAEIDTWLSRSGHSFNRTNWVLIAIGFAGLLLGSGTRTVITYFEWRERYDNIVMLVHLTTALALVIGCARLQLSAVQKRWDKSFGDLSYPIYISHYFFGLIAAQITGLEIIGRDQASLINLVVTLPMMLVGCWLMARLIDSAIEPMRDYIRAAAHKRHVRAT